MNSKVKAFVLVSVMTLLGRVAAQTDSPPPLMKVLPRFGVTQTKVGAASLRTEMMDAEPVKGLPFCATISTEHTQVFSDGNRIHTTDNSTLCRDSEGRIRRESALTLLGPAAQNPPIKLITIIDPVAGFRYLLDANAKIARKMPISVDKGPIGPSVARATETGGSGRTDVFFYRPAGASGSLVTSSRALVSKDEHGESESDSTTENLGDQTIDGIHATGSRVTTTIPSGKMGNEQPMVITSERWYSPEIEATVMTKHNDPWAGELKTQFTNISTSEPDSALFAVPSDYKIVDEKPGQLPINLLPPAPPAP